MPNRPVYTHSYAASLYLMAKGYTPIAIEPSRNGSGAIVYVFPLEAQEALNAFYADKTRLDQITQPFKLSR